MSLLSRSARSALAVRRAAVPTQAARLESTDASSSSAEAPEASADKSEKKASKPAKPTKKRDVSFEDRELERKLNLTERIREQSKIERQALAADQQKSYNAPYPVYPKKNIWDLGRMPTFNWDEPSSAGFLRIQQMEEMRSLMSKAEIDRPALQGEFSPRDRSKQSDEQER